MKIFLRLLLWSLGIAILYYGFQHIPLKEIGGQISQKVYVDRVNTKFLTDWTTDTVLTKINEARTGKGFLKLKESDKLDQAARSRLSVLLTDNDYSGSVTGLTREISVKNVGYTANLIGDLVLLDFFKSNDPISYWEGDTVFNEELLHADFKEVGIAVKNEADKVSVYVLLVSPRKIAPLPKKIVWGGPEVWEVVNKRRVELGVNPLSKKDELCTLASIRLNQLLELGKLDGHAGFVPLLDRADLKWITEKYNVSEYLAAGYASPQETIAGWEGTLGHRSLLAGGEYVWGCIYAQSGFVVAMAAY